MFRIFFDFDKRVVHLHQWTEFKSLLNFHETADRFPYEIYDGCYTSQPVVQYFQKIVPIFKTVLYVSKKNQKTGDYAYWLSIIGLSSCIAIYQRDKIFNFFPQKP